MRVEFSRPDAPDSVVASATWDGRSVEVSSEDETIGRALEHAYRATPVVVDDASYRQLGTSGEVVVQPGSLDWFRAATQVRAAAETSLAARFVPGVREGGFDPAAQYRSFAESMERLTRRADPA
jgi:hypothetical protein